MYGKDERDLCATLNEMHKIAIERAHWDRNEARNIMRDYLADDRRFDQFDPSRLVERIEECRSRGRTMELLDDPWLRKNGEKRPLSF